MIKLNLQGGIFLEMDDILCEIICSDNTHYFIRSCIKGFLLEINELLIQSPQLIQQKVNKNKQKKIILFFRLVQMVILLLLIQNGKFFNQKIII